MISLAPETLLLIDTKTLAAGTGTSRAINVEGRDELVFYFTSVGTTSGGILRIEEAYFNANTEPVYAGTWSQIGADVLASAFTGTAQQAVHISPNSYSYVRVRIATDITGGGTVSVALKMQ
jgi:hypothetical protein